MKPIAQCLIRLARMPLLALLTAVAALLAPRPAVAAGHFSQMTTSPPSAFNYPGHMLLLPDGRVMAQQSFGSNWYILTPDNQGHYIDGAWFTCPTMNYSREYYSSDVLPNGEVFVAGGEDGTGGSTAEIFNPQANGGGGAWTIINPPTSLMNPALQSPALANGNQAFLDSESIVLSNGNVLIAPVGPNVQGGTLIYNPSANNWAAGPLTASVYLDEASWCKLPDNSILTMDPYGTVCQRYIPSLNTWFTDQACPRNLWAGNGEIGASVLLTNGTVWYIGGNGLSEIYTPSGATSDGTWAPGPNAPSGMEMRDAPAAMLADGKILLTMGTTSGDSPFAIYEYNQNNNTYTSVFTDSRQITDQTSMLDLPDGTVLFNDTYDFYVYTQDQSPIAAGQPAIQSVTYDANGSLHLTGTLFNGISQGSQYGDDAQEDSNYPLVSFTAGNGNVYYGRSYNWSSTGVRTGSLIVGPEVALPSAVLEAPGFYSLQVIANGNPSAAESYYGPVWVDFNYTGSPQNGEYATPYETLAQGISAVPSGGTIALNASVQPSTTSVTPTITNAMTIISVNGPSTIGN